jgi:transcriptional regulator with XRE-family HTH domain
LAAKLTQEQLADRVGCTRRNVKIWESGESQPSARYAEKLLQIHEETQAGKAVIGSEKQLLRTFYNARDLIYSGQIDIKDVLDIIYEYATYELCEEILTKWEKLGFYHVRDTLSCGEVLWDNLPKAYKKILKS